MVGAKKITLDLKILIDACGPEIQQLLKEYNVIEISSTGSPEHTKAGISKDKVLVKAYASTYAAIHGAVL